MEAKSPSAAPATASPTESETQFWIGPDEDYWVRIKARLQFVQGLISAVLSRLVASKPRRFYGVRLDGTGICCPSVGPPVIGFFTTQMPFACSESDAIAEAKRVVMNRWRSDPMYVAWNKGELPRLEVDGTFLPAFWEAVFFMGKGHTLYADDSASSTSDCP